MYFLGVNVALGGGIGGVRPWICMLHVAVQKFVMTSAPTRLKKYMDRIEDDDVLDPSILVGFFCKRFEVPFVPESVTFFPFNGCLSPFLLG